MQQREGDKFNDKVTERERERTKEAGKVKKTETNSESDFICVEWILCAEYFLKERERKRRRREINERRKKERARRRGEKKTYRKTGIERQTD